MNICRESQDLYADLQLPPTADTESIKKNFRDLALRVHPDHNSKDEKANEKFCAIKKAYDILSDPGKKAEYDASRRHRRYQGPSCHEDNPWSKVTPQQPNQAKARPTPWRAQDQRFSAGVPNSKQYTKSKAEAAQPRNGASATTTGGKRRTPHPPPPPTASARHRKEASFGSRRNGFHPWATQKDEAPATSSNYSSRPRPVPQGPTSTATTDPPVTESPQAMNKDNTPTPTSTPPPRPREFPCPQPAQTTASPHPVEPPKRSEQPAESKQSTGTIPMPPAPQDTNDESTRAELQSDNVETPNTNQNRPVNPKTPFDSDKEGSGGGREFPTPPTAPQIPASIDGVQPSEIDKDTYLEDFKTYLKEWNLFKNQIIGHFLARKGTITNLQNSGSGDIQQYSDWLVQDAEIRGLFIAAVEEHEIQFRQFRQFMILFQM
ncbi:hypothetical protein FOXG_14106 [Fusarium oxysporum f. sp. lycopersici 4287]|uniref:J domain-containing protein n=2 Tax=Fusarium oxysporum TaxID=5507 RepID=A0A0J9WT96_FUSO4|nr:hypothetical protein FOXG_12431 [Fusarium oxysporum f. sp. lycopersici 4287]XP_018251729.1 hypothetical protein FOXG_12431 [Fusarium oxysporum f. sp. lycopersici 4287]XP_018253692.1 hypothetical protein FOXG_14106 [Fusarium oxysporum f. sp. lycopersici 4287]KAJ9412929.1 DnaJ domain-containing protein [Fusarium oxysporum]KNB13683.1 hypothetical protein FOXG_12431 [Fusarium oxysporum f. sp. lycopersici 4287]KNB13684.1 hypothetical protein FOXG_12431 [Fusarium oxysporum f. sp. lycopersici 4287